MCREAVASRDGETAGLAQGLNTSILFMLAFIFTMLATLVGMIVLVSRSRGRAQTD